MKKIYLCLLLLSHVLAASHQGAITLLSDQYNDEQDSADQDSNSHLAKIIMGNENQIYENYLLQSGGALTHYFVPTNVLKNFYANRIKLIAATTSLPPQTKQAVLFALTCKMNSHDLIKKTYKKRFFYNTTIPLLLGCLSPFALWYYLSRETPPASANQQSTEENNNQPQE